MTEQKPVFNPQAGTSKKKVAPQKKKKASVLFLLLNRRKERDPNTRTIRFAPRTAQSIVSFLFFSLFLVMCLVVILTFGRVDTLTRMAMEKQVNKEELVTNINNALKETEQLKYEGMKLTDRLFTLSHKDEGKKYWEEQLTPFLATGLSPNSLGLDTVSVDRIARNVRFIKMDTVNEREAIYRLYYDVRFTEGDTWRQVQVILPVSYAGQALKLLDRPTFTNLAPAEERNKSNYKENRFEPKGVEVKDQEKEKVIEFTKRFFELYVSNDEKLALVANVKGIGKAALEKVEAKKVLQTENGDYYVSGTYQFSFDERNPLTSQFALEIKPTKESYYVSKMNGVWKND